MRRVTTVIVHHTAGRDTQTAAEIRAFHTAPPPKGRGYSDIGYHWLVRRIAGGPWTVEAGRPEALVGAHDADENADSIGICIAGDYTKGPVPVDAWAVLVATVADVCRRHGLTADQVEGHREDEPAKTATACPGFEPELLRASVRLQLARAS